MNSPAPIFVADREKLSLHHIDPYYSINEKNGLDSIGEKKSIELSFDPLTGKVSTKEKSAFDPTQEKSAFNQWVAGLKQGIQSFESLMMLVNTLMQEFSLMVRDVNMKFTADFIQQRVDEFTKAVNKVIQSIKDIAFWDAFLGGVEATLCIVIAGFQWRSEQWANILATARDGFIGATVHAGGALLKQQPQVDAEVGNKEKTLNDVWHQIEQNARDWFKEASRLFAQLTEVMANLIQQLQPILGLRGNA